MNTHPKAKMDLQMKLLKFKNAGDNNRSMGNRSSRIKMMILKSS